MYLCKMQKCVVSAKANLQPNRQKRKKNEIGIHSLRLGNIIGEHTVVISTDTQRITLKHEAMDRRLFAEGACCAFRFISGRAPGLYDMADMVKNEN